MTGLTNIVLPNRENPRRCLLGCSDNSIKMPARTQWASRQSKPQPTSQGQPCPEWVDPAHLLLTELGTRASSPLLIWTQDENDDLMGQLVTDVTGERPKSRVSVVTPKSRFAGQQGKRNRWHSKRRGCWAEGATQCASREHVPSAREESTERGQWDQGLGARTRLCYLT